MIRLIVFYELEKPRSGAIYFYIHPIMNLVKMSIRVTGNK